MDKVYIDSKGKNTTVELPKYGEVTLVIQDGKVMRLETKSTQKLVWKGSKLLTKVVWNG